jgi:hypothetical protein
VGFAHFRHFGRPSSGSRRQILSTRSPKPEEAKTVPIKILLPSHYASIVKGQLSVKLSGNEFAVGS